MKIFKFLKPYWPWALMSALFMVGEVVFDLLLPQIMSKIVDEGVLSDYLASEKIRIVITYGIIMLIYLVVGGFCGVSSGVCASTASNSFGNDVRKSLFKKVTNLSYEQTDKFSTGSLVTRITNDVTQVQNFVAMSVRMFVRTIFLFFGGIVMMYVTDHSFALVLAVILPIQVVIMLLFLRKATPVFKVVQGKIDKVNSIVQENVGGVRVVKAYVNEDYESNRFNDANVDLSLTTLKVQKLLALIGPILTIILNVVVVAIIYIGGYKIQNVNINLLTDDPNYMTVGKVMAGLTYIMQVLMGVMQMAMIAASITRAKVSINRINEVMDSDPIITSDVEEGTAYPIKKEDEGTIEFKHVDFAYPNSSGQKVVDDFNLKIKKGEKIAILGATGSGKSSIVNLIPRFYDVTSGEVLVDGINVKDYNLKDLRGKISMILQSTEIFSGSIEENVRWGKDDASFEEIQKAVDIAQVRDYIESNYSDGYKHEVGERGNNLSGGQKQRVSIARGLVRNPRFIVFDDSTSALDLATEARLHKALKENMNNATVIIIAQRVASAKNCDRIAVIDNGKLVACDTHEKLMESCAIYQDIYNSQLKRGDGNE